MIVLDASAAVELLLRTRKGAAVFERISRTGESLHAPHLLDIEVMSALRRRTRAGAMSPRRAAEAVGDLRSLAFRRYPHALLLPRVWELRDNATAYDASYLALAEALAAPLVTCDRRLGGVPGHDATVEVIAA